MTEHKSKPWRRLLRFGVRTLLLLVTLACLWIAWWAHSARVQREAVRVIHQAGGTPVYNWQVRGTPSKRKPGVRGEILPDFPRWIPKWIRSALGDEYFQKVVAVEIGANRDVGDEWLDTLPDLPYLKSVRIAVPNFTDDDLARLTEIDTLESIYLFKPEISDSGLLRLQDCTSLKDLQLNLASVNPKTVKELESALPQCEIWFQPGDTDW